MQHADPVDAFPIEKAIKNAARHCVNGKWETKQEWADNMVNSWWRNVLWHEFGHALGLIHEHQNPGGAIPWNREAVIRDLSGPPNNWSLQTIEHNMFEPYAKADTNYTTLDKASIMMYPIPVSWTTNGFSVGLNGDLSPTDKSFIRNQYQ